MSATTPTPGKRAGRSGGRAARVAARAAGLPDDEKAGAPVKRYDEDDLLKKF